MEMAESTFNLLMDDFDKFSGFCNGVGSKENWWKLILWKFTPNTILFLNITRATDIHDVEFSWPIEFRTERDARAFFLSANERLLLNLITLIEGADGFSRDRTNPVNKTWVGIVSLRRVFRLMNRIRKNLIRVFRLKRASLYYMAVSSDSAYDSFLSSRTILTDR